MTRVLKGKLLEQLGRIEIAGQNPTAALAALREADAILADLGERGRRASAQAQLAAAYQQLGKRHSAKAALELAEALGGDHDLDVLMVTTRIRARLALADENLVEGEKEARRAMEYASRTDAISAQGEARMELARVLAAVDNRGEAESVAREALELFDTKGDQPNAAHARALLDHLESR